MLEGDWTLFCGQQGIMEEKGCMEENNVGRYTWEGKFVIWSAIYLKNT